MRLFVFLWLLLSAANAAKLRSWLDGSVSFVEGEVPSARCCHGFTSAMDGKIYLFGGQQYGVSGGGDQTQLSTKSRIVPC